jgi:hypothetical protein
MNADDLQGLLAADPFEPFELNTADGHCYEVTDRAQVAFLPGGRLIDWRKGEHRRLVVLAHVTNVGFPRPPAELLFLRKK